MAIISKIINKYRRLPIQIKASIWALICGVLNKCVQVITTPIFTRIMTTDEYGHYNVFLSWLNILTIILTLYLSAGVYAQGLVKFEDKKREFSSTMQGLTLTLMLFWTVVYFIFQKYWNSLFNLTTIQMLIMLLMIWLSAVFNFWATEQKNEYKYKALILVTLSVSFFSPSLGIVLILNSDDKVTARILGTVIVELIIYIWLFLIQTKNGKKFFDLKFWKYAIIYNLPLVPHYLSQVVLSGADRIMIEKAVGESEAGIYSLAYSLSMIMLIVNNALMQSLSPWIYRKIKSKDISSIAPIAYSSLACVAILNILLISFAPEAVRIFAPVEYYEAIWIIPPVAISVFFIYSYDLFAKFSFYYEKRVFITLASIVGAVLNIILNYIFIDKFGYIAAGYTTLVCYIIYAFGHYQIMNRICNKYCNGDRPYNGKIIVLISAIFTITGLLMLLTYNYFIIRYSIIGLMIIVCIIMNKRIIASIKKIFSLKKEQD